MISWLKRWGGWLLSAVMTVATLGLWVAVRRPKPSTPPQTILSTQARPMRQKLLESVEESAEKARQERARAADAQRRAKVEAKRVRKLSDEQVVEMYRKRFQNKGRPTSLLLVFGFLAFTGTAYATEPVEAPHPVTGETGLWLSFEQARAEAVCEETQPELLKQLEHLRDTAQSERDARIKLREVADGAIAQAEAATAVARDASAEVERLDVWWRRGRFWAPAGFVLGIVGTSVLVVVAK